MDTTRFAEGKVERFVAPAAEKSNSQGGTEARNRRSIDVEQVFEI